MTLMMKGVLIFALSVFACAWPGVASADMDLPNKSPLFAHSAYDYAPSIIQEGNIRKYWWCGEGTVPGTSFVTDVIYYRTHDASTNSWTPIVQVLAPTVGSWDGHFLCDPSVIRGQFTNPENAQTYSYAMYYTATDNTAGLNNRIGVAFSNNGTSWVKFSQPVIYPANSPTTTYGAGQAATYNSNGIAGIRIFYTDKSASQPNKTYTRTTTNGINFGVPVAISSTNNAGVALTTSNDYAYDYVSRYYYAVIETAPFRSGDRESYQFGLFRMPASNLIAGTGTWEALGFINSAKTGYDLNHNPGIVRDSYGNVTGSLPNISTVFGAGSGGSGTEGTWDIAQVVWRASPANVPLVRSFGSLCADHWVTTGYIATTCGYHYESTLGYLSMKPVSGTKPLYGCIAGTDHFMSTSATCEGQRVLGIEGWVYTTQVASSAPIYRCKVTDVMDHFVSKSSSCEEQTVEYLLGYIIQ